MDLLVDEVDRDREDDQRHGPQAGHDRQDPAGAHARAGDGIGGRKRQHHRQGRPDPGGDHAVAQVVQDVEAVSGRSDGAIVGERRLLDPEGGIAADLGLALQRRDQRRDQREVQDERRHGEHRDAQQHPGPAAPHARALANRMRPVRTTKDRARRIRDAATATPMSLCRKKAS